MDNYGSGVSHCRRIVLSFAKYGNLPLCSVSVPNKMQ